MTAKQLSELPVGTTVFFRHVGVIMGAAYLLPRIYAGYFLDDIDEWIKVDEHHKLVFSGPGIYLGEKKFLVLNHCGDQKPRVMEFLVAKKLLDCITHIWLLDSNGEMYEELDWTR